MWNYGKLSAKFLVSSIKVIDTVGFLSFFKVLLEQLLKFLLIILNRRYEYANKNSGNTGFVFMCNFSSVKPSLHIFVTIAQHACNRVLVKY